MKVKRLSLGIFYYGGFIMKRILLISTMSALFLGSTCPSFAAQEKRGTASRVWTACTKKLPRIVKAGAEGAVAAYAAYLAVNWSKDYVIPSADHFLNALSNGKCFVTNGLLKSGTIAAGLALLAWKAGKSCIHDVSNL